MYDTHSTEIIILPIVLPWSFYLVRLGWLGPKNLSQITLTFGSVFKSGEPKFLTM